MLGRGAWRMIKDDARQRHNGFLAAAVRQIARQLVKQMVQACGIITQTHPYRGGSQRLCSRT